LLEHSATVNRNTLKRRIFLALFRNQMHNQMCN
jgi:hypothetical protein